MSIGSKKKPSDGSAEEAWLAQQAFEQQRKAEADANLEKFEEEAERDYETMQKQKTERLGLLKKARSVNTAGARDEQADTGLKRYVNGQEIEPHKAFNIYNHEGIFNTRGERKNYQDTSTKTAIASTLKNKSQGVSAKKQREFIQLLDRYHGLTGSGQMLRKGEIQKLEAGLRRGDSNEAFKKLSRQLVSEGTIKKAEDIKKMFTRSEVRRMSSALTGKQQHDPFQRADRTELLARREGKDPNAAPPRR